MSDRSFVWQFSPALRPFLQTVVISMVSYGEMYGKHQTGLGGSRYASSEIASCCGSSRRAPLPGLAALSLLTSAKYVIDPELRGAQFERITQNLDMDFWKSFWNLTESGLLTVGVLRHAPAHLHTDTVLSLCTWLCRASAEWPPAPCRSTSPLRCLLWRCSCRWQQTPV